jgi:hypothetical protein
MTTNLTGSRLLLPMPSVVGARPKHQPAGSARPRGAAIRLTTLSAAEVREA